MEHRRVSPNGLLFAEKSEVAGKFSMLCCCFQNAVYCTTLRITQIFIGNVPAPNFRNNTQCMNVPYDVTPPSLGSGPFSTTISCVGTGRYVQIVRPWSLADDAPDYNIISICELQVNANISTAVSGPQPRQGHAAAFYRGQMVVAGGANSAGTQLNDVQMLDISTNTWTVVGTIGGTTPVARAYAAMLPSGANNALALFGGSAAGAAQSDLNVLTFPACGTFSSFGTQLSCLAAGTSCAVTCATNFLRASAPFLICGPNGDYLSTAPPCVAPMLEAPPAGAGVAPNVTVIDYQSVSVTWTNITPANTGYSYAQYINYQIQTQQQLYFFNNFESGVLPADWPSWMWMDGTGGQQFYSFQSGQMTISTSGIGNCAGGAPNSTTMLCAGAFRKLPQQTDPTAFFIEGMVSLDRTDINVNSMLGGIAIYDARYSYPAVVLGVSGSGVIWRTSIIRTSWNNLTYPSVFTQTNALPNPALPSVYLRIVYSGGLITPSYRQSLTASWTPVFSIPQSALYGGAIPASSFYVGWTTNNWSGPGARGTFFLSYFSIGPATCTNPGTVRRATAGRNSVIISGLSGGTTYAAQVAGVDQYGVGAFTPASVAFSTPAAPAAISVPVINVALLKPATSPPSYQWGAQTPPSLLVDGYTTTTETSSCGPGLWCCFDSNGVSPWAMIDLGKPSDIQSMTLWARSDVACTNQFGQIISCAIRSNGLNIFVGNSPSSFSANTLCPNVNIQIFSAPWSYTFPCQLTGRYVWIASPFTNLNFCELQVRLRRRDTHITAAWKQPCHSTQLFTGLGSKSLSSAVICICECRVGFILY